MKLEACIQQISQGRGNDLAAEKPDGVEPCDQGQGLNLVLDRARTHQIEHNRANQTYDRDGCTDADQKLGGKEVLGSTTSTSVRCPKDKPQRSP